MKNNIFSKFTNYERIYLALSVILGILYIVVRNIKTNNYIILLFLAVSMIILLILTYVFAYKMICTPKVRQLLEVHIFYG